MYKRQHQWCIAAVPGKAWAKKVFPELSEKKAVEEMWKVILYTARADGKNPVKDWKAHNADLESRCAYLNGLGLKYLRYKSADGTDLQVELNEDGIFCGGDEKTLKDGCSIPIFPARKYLLLPRPVRRRASSMLRNLCPIREN